MSFLGRMPPRVPSNAVAQETATAEALREFSEGHIAVDSQELDAMPVDPLRQVIPEFCQYVWSPELHGVGMPM